MKPTRLLPLATFLLVSLSACQPDGEGKAPTRQVAANPAAASAHELIAHGEYLVRIAGCNDCHTPGYMDQQGNVDKAAWLTGNQLGFNGPWGTTYPANLRIKLADMDEAAWLAYTADLHTRPMMPDFNVRAMSADDRRAIFRFIKSLGPGGAPAPAYLPPGQQPTPPYVQLVLPSPATPTAAPAAPGAAVSTATPAEPAPG